MGQLLVQVDAEGVISDDLRAELAGVLAGQQEADVTMLSGVVLDAAALMGLLHRLHHAGLSVVSMDAVPATEDDASWALGTLGEVLVTMDLRGMLDDVLVSLLGDGQVVDEFTTTTIRFRLAPGAALAQLLNRIEALNLELVHLSVHPPSR
ncbi:MAG: hypothetical protein WBL05_03300 [Brooklawnia sp.]|uniref:hypothetical protein n=1 Tax=Brooklawnia sp. TaxID=2699740 RepID=UPI003C736A97